MPFISELLALLGVIGIESIYLLHYSGLVVIQVKWKLPTILGTTLLSIYFIRYASRILNWGFRAVLDLLIPQDITLCGKAEAQHPLYASELTSHKTKEGIDRVRCYYIIEVAASNSTVTLISPIYVPLKADWYLFLFSG